MSIVVAIVVLFVLVLALVLIPSVLPTDHSRSLGATKALTLPGNYRMITGFSSLLVFFPQVDFVISLHWVGFFGPALGRLPVLPYCDHYSPFALVSARWNTGQPVCPAIATSWRVRSRFVDKGAKERSSRVSFSARCGHHGQRCAAIGSVCALRRWSGGKGMGQQSEGGLSVRIELASMLWGLFMVIE
jgi:hypothetical protein